MCGLAGSSSDPAGSSSGAAQPVSQACETALRPRDQTKRRADQEARRREVHSTEGTRGYGQTRRRHARADSRHVSIPCVCFRHMDTQNVSICTHCIYLHIDTQSASMCTLPIPCSVHTSDVHHTPPPLPFVAMRTRTRTHAATQAHRHARTPSPSRAGALAPLSACGAAAVAARRAARVGALHADKRTSLASSSVEKVEPEADERRFRFTRTSLAGQQGRRRMRAAAAPQQATDVLHERPRRWGALALRASRRPVRRPVRN
jgi:hypothetical protein